MGSFKGSLESLSQSLGLSWRNGDFIEWILEGISDPKAEKSDPHNVIQKAFKTLDGSFPMDILRGETNEDGERIYLRISWFMAYFASVKHGWQPLKRALLGLKMSDQLSIEKMFSLILEEKWNDPLFRDSFELDCMEVSKPLPCPTTPINRFKKIKTRSSPSTFNFSPNSSSHLPLKDFFTSPVTAQISKYQKIAEEKTKLLRATRLELDHEKLETFNLAREREELIKERKTLRKSLESVRANLYSKQWSEEDGDNVSDSSYDYLQKRLAETKENETYVLKMEEQLRDALDERNELSNKVESQNAKLEESSLLNTKLESRVIELSASLHSEKEFTKDLVGKCEDLEVQVLELQEILDSRRTALDNINQPSHRVFENAFDGGWSVFPSASLGDISMDDHPVSMDSAYPFPQGENMAETLVIPELEEKLSLVSEQLHDYITKFTKLEEELDASKKESEQLKRNLADANQSVDELQRNNDKLDHENSILISDLASLRKSQEESFSVIANAAELINNSKKSSPSPLFDLKLNDLCYELQDMKKSLDIYDKEYQSETSNINELFHELKKKYTEFNNSLKEEHESLKESYKKKEEDLIMKLRKSNEEKESLMKKIKISEENIHEFEETVSKLKKELDEEVDARNKEIKIIVSQMSEKYKSKENELTSLCNRLKNELNSLKTENADLRSQIDELKNVIKKLESSKSQHKSELDVLRIKLLKKNDEHMSTQSELRTKLENKEKEVREKTSQLVGIKNRIDELKNSLNKEVVGNQSLQKSLENFEDQQKIMDAQKTRITELETQLHQLFEEKENDKGSHEKELEELTRKWKTESESFDTKIYESNRRLEMKIEELNEVKQKLSSLLNAKFSIAFENRRSLESTKNEPDVMNACKEPDKIPLNQEQESLQSVKKEVHHQSVLISKSVHEITRKENTLGHIFGDEIIKMRNEMETKMKNQLAAQKTRYESRVNVIAENISKQYKEKMDQLVKVKDAEIEEAKSGETLKEYEKKYCSALNKISELSKKLDEGSAEISSVTKKYTTTKNVILKLKEDNEALRKKLESSPNTDSFNQSIEIERLKLQLKKIKTENRQLSVQFSAAETKIRQLQKNIDLDSEFKVPKVPLKDTPGRTKAGRTRSEAYIHSRRPPFGSGALFNIDDEDGESFSNSYLNDSSQPDIEDKERLNELMRRNVLQPAHLKSSYPVETQFYSTDSFKESDLVEGKEEKEALSLTLGPDNPSPKPKGLRPHSIIGIFNSEEPSGCPKRQNTSIITRHSFHSNTYFITDEKGPKPDGSSESVLTESNANDTSEIDGVPRISNETCTASKSPIISKSLKSFLVHTPFKLRSVVRSALGTKKSYDMKTTNEEGSLDPSKFNYSPLLIKKKSLTKKRLGKKK